MTPQSSARPTAPDRREFLTAAAAAASASAFALAAGARAAAEDDPKGGAKGREPVKTGHVVLLGDSIFDNGSYVKAGDPDVVKQVRDRLPGGWTATLLAVDGSTASGVPAQLMRMPADATHLVVSVGGNDALGKQYILNAPANSSGQVYLELSKVRAEFADNYGKMLAAVLALKKPTAVCTIYDPNFEEPERRSVASAALSAFNDAITRAAFKAGVPLIDLRLLFDDPADYANPIEPSAKGGAKLARVIAELVTGHDFSAKRTGVFV